MVLKKEKQVDLFTPRKKSSENKNTKSPKPLTEHSTEKKHTKAISEIFASARGNNIGYEWEDYLRICEYYERHPDTQVPERPETLGKGHYPMKEIVAYTRRSKI